jgi:hypothetical protein
MYFNRLDICEAHYLFAANCHIGMFSKVYVKFGQLERIKFRPGAMLRIESLSENAREIYDALVAKAGL